MDSTWERRPSARTSVMARSSQHRDVVFQIPGGVLHLVAGSDVAELARGDFVIQRILAGDVLLATVAKVGNVLWPLTRDEPVVKVDEHHYLFTLPDKDGGFVNYGVSFPGPDARLVPLDQFLKENTCFRSSSRHLPGKSSAAYDVYWRNSVPRIEDYNNILARAIVGGTGEIVKGIFKLSDIYITQVQRGADWILRDTTTGGKPSMYSGGGGGSNKGQGEVGKIVKQVRKLSEATEKVSGALLDGVLGFNGTVTAPFFQSRAGKAFFGTAPGEVVLASLDAVNKALDAVEAAERKTIAATSIMVSGAVSKRFGEGAGEATEDAFATAGHVVGTAWNVFKIRKAVKPSSSLPSAILKNAVKMP